MVENWKERSKPARLERRIEFDDYEQTRYFLEKAADLAEREGYYPDISFGRSHVSMTVYSQEDEASLSQTTLNYASEVNKLANAAKKVL
ncbi:MAG: 4a-hydroxytetrahydrobiopterin dehydratase [Gammaproteobacteria bacterium]|nr:4a-hydroxytetrahydrobiopterin dehydratase [Gammaproteobacteria bacterium]MDH5731903.1 4a-hydroxytetrahydrobiopterin dehydratase [Gammaproteobacteria bacterium]